MKTFNSILIAGVLTFTLALSHAQPGGRGGGGMGGPPGPKFGGDMAKIFGENKTFSASLEFEIKDKSGDATTMPGKIAYLEGQSRFEMDMTQMKSAKMPEGMGEQMKQMGMDKMTAISRPDKKLSYIIYPGMNAHVETPLKDADASKVESDYKMEVTELGKEKLDGHDCVKNKVVVTDKDGKKHESTVWNASDMKKFPVKIETTDSGNNIVMLFKEVKLAKPDAALFDPPKDSTKYTDMMTLMQTEMMKKMGGGGGFTPPGR